MQRKKILWLVSWYPNKNDRFDGDFIQRHARAAAIFHTIHVIFVTETEMEQPIEQEWHQATNITEQIIYFKKKKGPFARLYRQLRWKKLFQKAVEEYISKNGKPDGTHVHIPWKSGLIALWLKKKYHTPFLVSEHWGMYDAAGPEYFHKKPALQQ